jgi:hypothetical protein
MADTPKYTRQTPIQPGQAVGGFSQAAHGVGAATDAIGKFGLDMAQQGANKLATLQGIEAAKQGKKISPIQFGEAGKHYEEAYNKESVNNLSYQGNKLLSQLQYTAAKQPTGNSLNEFQMHGQNSIEQLVSQAPKQYQPDLRRSLESSFDSSFYQLANKVDVSNREYMASQQLLQDNQQLERISNAGLELEGVGAEQALKDRMATIASREQLYVDTGGVEGYDPATAGAHRKAAENRFFLSRAQREYVEAQKAKKGAEYLADLREHKPAGLTPLEHDNLVKGVLAYANEYQAAFSAQQAVNFTQYATKVDTGQMTESDLIQAKNDVSELQYAKLENHIAKRNLKQIQATQLHNEAIGHLDDAGFMSQYTGDQLNSIYNKQLELKQASKPEGEQISIVDRAEVAKGMQVSVPEFTKRMSAELLSNDPVKATQAAQIWRGLNGSNPLSVQGISSDAESKALKMSDSMARGTPPIDAYNNATEQAIGATKQGVKERGQEFDELLKTAGSRGRGIGSRNLGNVVNAEIFVAKQLGVNQSRLPAGLTTDFMQSARENFVKYGGTLEDAFGLAKLNIDRSYPETDINGYRERMYLGYHDKELMKESLRLHLNNLFEQFSKTEEGPVKFQWENPSSFGKWVEENLAPKSTEEQKQRSAFRVHMIDRDGNSVAGQIMVKSDGITSNPQPGESQSWGIFFVPDGKRNPQAINVPGTFTQARFSIDNELVNNKMAIQAEQERLMWEQKQLYNSIEKQRRQAEFELRRKGFGDE